MMSHHRHHGSKEFLAFLAGRAIGASRALNQQTPTSSDRPNVRYSQTHTSDVEIPLPASRVDHAEAVLGYLHNYETELLNRRKTTNEKNEDRRPLLSQIPMWPRPAFPTNDEIIQLLNREAVWTVSRLETFSHKLAIDVFSAADRCFNLFAPDSATYLAKTIEEKFSRWKQERLLAISMLNKSARYQNSELSIIQRFNQKNFSRIIPNVVIRIPSLQMIEMRIKNSRVETWADFHSLERDLEREVFAEVFSDVDSSRIESQRPHNWSLGSETQSKLYKEHRVRLPEFRRGVVIFVLLIVGGIYMLPHKQSSHTHSESAPAPQITSVPSTEVQSGSNNLGSSDTAKHSTSSLPTYSSQSEPDSAIEKQAVPEASSSDSPEARPLVIASGRLSSVNVSLKFSSLAELESMRRHILQVATVSSVNVISIGGSATSDNQETCTIQVVFDGNVDELIGALNKSALQLHIVAGEWFIDEL